MDADAVLRRVERNALALCGAMTIAAVAREGIAVARRCRARRRPAHRHQLLVDQGRVSRLVGSDGAVDRRVPRARIAFQLAGRYALLGFMAYVMIARLRLHPLGLLAGASSIVAAVTVEAVRVFSMKKS